MKNIFSRYVSQFDWTKIMDELISKLISLAILFILFFLAKKLLRSMVKRILKPSLNYVGQDDARKKTILRLVESLPLFHPHLLDSFHPRLASLKSFGGCWNCRSCHWDGSSRLLIGFGQWLLYSS